MKHVELIIDYLLDGDDFQYFDNTGIIVRCKDCKHFYADVEYSRPCAYPNGLIFCRENDYCSYGERKESEE